MERIVEMAGWRLRRLANLVNGSTLLGRAVAAAGRCEVRPAPCGFWHATSYRLPVPTAPAFTVGDVIITRHVPGWLEARPRLLAHEERHSLQYAVCLGLPLLPLYAIAAGWSWLRGGDACVHNPFERLAGLADGGYPTLSARERRRRQAA